MILGVGRKNSIRKNDFRSEGKRTIMVARDSASTTRADDHCNT